LRQSCKAIVLEAIGLASFSPKGAALFGGTTNSTSSPWLVWPRPNPDAQLRLFCFPYAGGSANIYRNWPAKLQTDLEIIPIELPGRGSRINEEPLNRLAPLVEAAAQAIVPHLNKPYAFFGHSMGALVSFELARYLRRHHPREPAPSHLFVSGRGAPQCDNGRLMVDTLTEPELMSEVQRLNGTPPEVLADPELMALVLPVVRADFAVWDHYVYEDEEPLACPITAYGGLRDRDMTRAQIAAWEAQTSSAFRLCMFPGDHFFIHADERLLLRTLARELSDVISRK
jgi:medium-chain acyl-[acyl-carrier-protein] hydrolase